MKNLFKNTTVQVAVELAALLIALIPVLFICFIWSDNILIFKLIATDFVLLVTLIALINLIDND